MTVRERGDIKGVQGINVQKDGVTVSSLSDTINFTGGATVTDVGGVATIEIEQQATFGRFLSLWNCATGQPLSFPETTPYTYLTGDYFVVETVSSATPPVNYKPDGSSYTGIASTTVETDVVKRGDSYVYDGTDWLLQHNANKGDMMYADYYWKSLSGNSIALDLSTEYTPSNNFTVNAPATIEDGQIYVLRVNNGATAYTMTLGSNIVNLQGTDTSLTANATDMFVFLAINGQLELQKELQEPIVYTAGTNITISPTNEISATDTTYSSATSLVAGIVKLGNDTAITDTIAQPGTATGKTYPVQLNASGQMGVNVPRANTTYGAGTGISIGTIYDYSAMRGPCSAGFHVPTATELDALIDMGISLGAWSSNNGAGVNQYLHMPYAGDRLPSSSNIDGQGSFGEYWTCIGDSNDDASFLSIDSSSISGPRGQVDTKYGCSVRGIKDSAVIPDNTWTKTYNGTGNAGIYENTTLGLISISSDGTNWITISNKNEGATTVYNTGDTLSEANCGKYFQRGNNYGFSRTGTITTSSTKVDTTGYGPGNYYSGTSFIAASGWGWTTDDNKDLRGGETGVVTLNNAITNTGVLSVNGQTGNVTGMIQNDTTGTTTTVTKIWAGTESEFALITPTSGVEYHVYPN